MMSGIVIGCAFVINERPFPMNTKMMAARGRALGARLALVTLVLTLLSPIAASAEDDLGLVLQPTPAGQATRSLTMGIATEATGGTIPIFLLNTSKETLYGLRLRATPLVGDNGDVSVTPGFDREQRTIPNDGVVVRFDVSVQGLKALGRYTSTLYATHFNRTETLGTLTVVHTLRSGDLQIAAIAPARSTRQFPGSGTTVSLLVTILNRGDAPASISSLVLSGLDSGGVQATKSNRPSFRVLVRDGSPARAPYVIAAGAKTTLLVVLGGVKDTGRFTGSLRLSAPGHAPVEQVFAFQVKQGPLLPVLLILLGVGVAYMLRRAYSSGRIARVGQQRLVARLGSDLHSIRTTVPDLEPREALIVETLERRLGDLADELEVARLTKNTGVLSEIDHKIDLLPDLITARRYVTAMSPASLRSPYEARLDEVAAFLTETTQVRDLTARFEAFATELRAMPAAVEATVLERLQGDVDRFLAAVEANPAVVEALPLRVLNRIAKGKELADDGRFTDARAELSGAQMSFARVLAEDLLARLPDADSAPPGFLVGWPRFRATTAENLKAVRRQRRGDVAAEAYRAVWQDYIIELSSKLRSSAARERRKAAGARKEQLGKVMEACDAAGSLAVEFDPSAVEAYRYAVQGYLTALGRKPSAAGVRAALEEAHLPPPLTVVAAGLGSNGRPARVPPNATQSAASLTALIRKRAVGLALIAGVAAIPTGLAVLWAPNEVWGSTANAATAFGWGAGLTGIAALMDARRLGFAVSRRARSAPERIGPAQAPGPVGRLPRPALGARSSALEE
jgi:hypothetical protein